MKKLMEKEIQTNPADILSTFVLLAGAGTKFFPSLTILWKLLLLWAIIEIAIIVRLYMKAKKEKGKVEKADLKGADERLIKALGNFTIFWIGYFIGHLPDILTGDYKTITINGKTIELS